MTNKPISEVIAEIQRLLSSIEKYQRQGKIGEWVEEYRIATCPAELRRVFDHIAALEQQNARLQFIVESADKVQKEFADELRCAGDNESVLEAIDALKQQLAAERADTRSRSCTGCGC
ncbi:hypothetical protein [Pectobacterium aroidearum]|uniref:hypothetical protein n=1 Tax=Pectobacterium aroidearum TaxID=1201031 RepID=UPI001CD5E00A|nr:hypothetical protein [Pectobacterium aroidearum]